MVVPPNPPCYGRRMRRFLITTACAVVALAGSGTAQARHVLLCLPPDVAERLLATPAWAPLAPADAHACSQDETPVRLVADDR